MGIDLKIVKSSDLPEHFRPLSRRSSQERPGRPSQADQEGSVERLSEAGEGAGKASTEDLPSLFLDLMEEATGELTEKEKEAFLSRITGSKTRSLQGRPSSSGPSSSGPSSEEPPGDREQKKILVRWLKEEANRFMAAAARAQASQL